VAVVVEIDMLIMVQVVVVVVQADLAVVLQEVLVELIQQGLQHSRHSQETLEHTVMDMMVVQLNLLQMFLEVAVVLDKLVELLTLLVQVKVD
jgi:hypothetical protein